MTQRKSLVLFLAASLLVALALGTMLGACGERPGPEGEDLSVEEHFQRGNEYTQQGMFDEAIAEYQVAIEADPENVSALTNLGVAFYNVGRLQDAVDQYQRALEIAPNDADIHSNLAAAYVQLGQLDAALEEYQAAVRLDPDLAQAHFGLGVIYTELGQNEEAIAAFERFQALDEGLDTMATDLARQYLEQLRGE
ncbi:MAG: tetratricopeptide repeat protein [Anaerolineae bacterium]|nr:tetratricopeptide repeat protein [Anaerolineae bacterium]